MEILGATSHFPALDRLEAALQHLLDHAGEGHRDVTVVLMHDADIAEHNERDRGVHGPTDVLSYPTHEPDDVNVPRIAHLGDVLINLDQARRQGEEHGHGFIDEVLILAAHGLTHLRGYDHPDEASWAPFRDAQRRIVHWTVDA